ncbi:MAG TPA: hypothetical protein VFZ57_06645 [Thermoanaerobaculia bacterium]|nr:hypothetical protein [Thermoanaerobaculia bacterium]
MRRLLLSVAAVLLAAFAVRAEERLEFEPKVGAVGSRVVVKSGVPAGAQLLLGGRPVGVVKEAAGISAFIVPPGVSGGAFLEIVSGGKTVAKSAVPFIVSGASFATPPKLIGLKEAIDVFGYSDPRPVGGEKPEPRARPVLKLDEDEILTIGEPGPFLMMPAVEGVDLASAGHTGMSGTGLLITARPPKRKTPVPLPPPPPQD